MEGKKGYCFIVTLVARTRTLISATASPVFFVNGFDILWCIGSFLMLVNAVYTTILCFRPRRTNVCNFFNVIIVFLAGGSLIASCVWYFVYKVNHTIEIPKPSFDRSSLVYFNWSSYLAICGAATGLLALIFTFVEACCNCCCNKGEDNKYV